MYIFQQKTMLTT